MIIEMPKYFLDTSALIEFRKQSPNAWKDKKIQEELERGIRSEEYIIISHVYNELIRRKDKLKEWEKRSLNFFEEWLTPFAGCVKECNVKEYNDLEVLNKVLETYFFFLRKE